MAILVILVLVGLWAAVLVPPILRSRNAPGHHGVSDFMHHLRALGPGSGHRSHELGGPVLHGPVGVPAMGRARVVAPPGVGAPAHRPSPGGMSPMQRRRRNVLFVLAGGVAFTFLLGLVTGSKMLWALFVLALAALGGYVYLLVQFKNRAASQSAPSRRVYAPPVSAEVDEPPRIGDNVVVLRSSVG